MATAAQKTAATKKTAAKKTATAPAAKKAAATPAKKAAAAPIEGRPVCKTPGCEKLAVMRGDAFAYGGYCSKHYNEARAARKAAKVAGKADTQEGE
jgi:hypothetical protein